MCMWACLSLQVRDLARLDVVIHNSRLHERSCVTESSESFSIFVCLYVLLFRPVNCFSLDVTGARIDICTYIKRIKWHLYKNKCVWVIFGYLLRKHKRAHEYEHEYTYIYIYICMCVCVCVCASIREIRRNLLHLSVQVKIYGIRWKKRTHGKL